MVKTFAKIILKKVKNCGKKDKNVENSQKIVESSRIFLAANV